jgi:hypothetical protein
MHFTRPSLPGFAAALMRPRLRRKQAWPAIRAARHVLIAAPTGSGKTFAAFLTAIDELVRTGLAAGLPDETQVVYVSPLKALSNDIKRNLEAPLAGIREELARARLCRMSRSAPWCAPVIRPERAGEHAPPSAAHHCHDPRVALHPPRLRVGPEGAGDDAHGDRG